MYTITITASGQELGDAHDALGAATARVKEAGPAPEDRPLSYTLLEHDENSAYTAQIALFPDLKMGTWI